jgi:spore maturation protein CgeB
MSALKVLVCSASPDRVNHNAILRNYVARGFADLLGDEQVMYCSLDLAETAVNRFKPDLVLVFGSCMPDSSDYNALRQYCTRSMATLAFWLHDDPYEFDFNYKIYQYADVIFSNDQWAVTHYDHPRVFHLPLAADPKAHFRPLNKTIARDVFFCGVGFENRITLLKDCKEIFRSHRVEIYGAEWPDDLEFCSNKRLDNSLLPDFYASSLITLNMGRRFNLANKKYQLDASTPGPRTFEAALSGAVQCMFVEGLEITEYFVPDKEIILFDSPKELNAVIEMLLGNPTLRRSISQASQERAVQDHTYSARAKKILASVNMVHS